MVLFKNISLLLLSALFAVVITACNKTSDNAGSAGGEPGSSSAGGTTGGSDSMSQHADNAKESVDDAAITVKVKTAILDDPALKVAEIHVSTNGGVVTLTGTVDSAQNSDHAKAVVGAVDGVKSVDNQLTVKAGG